MGFLEEIKRKAKGESESSNEMQSMLIMQQFNKLFYMRENREEERAGLHASSITASDNDFCYREQMLSLLYKQNQGENFSVGLMRIFAAGNSIHEKWQKLFVLAKIAIGIESRSFSEQWEVYLTPDAILELLGKQWICEIKSVNTYQFKKMKSHPKAEKQAQFYMHFMGIPRALILCEDKNTQEVKIFIIK